MEQSIYDFHQQKQYEHWWFRGRFSVIRRFLALGRYPKHPDCLDIGSGYGAVIPALRELGEVDALEPHAPAHAQLRSLGVRTIHRNGNFPDTVPKKKYDIVVMADVLEHIRDDGRALSRIARSLLRPGGYALITVPAYQWLWSDHDRLNKHCRRYTKAGLRDLLCEHGFSIERMSYFITLLFPFGVLMRFLPGAQGKDTGTLPSLINRFFTFLVACEGLIAARIPLPFGMSVIALAKKPMPLPGVRTSHRRRRV